MSTPLHQRLYLRIWLAVVVTIAVVTLVAGWLGSQEAERERSQRPGREITIKSSSGEVLGQTRARPNVVPGQGAEFQVAMNDGSTLVVQFSRPPRPPGSAEGDVRPGMGGMGGRPSPPPRLPFNFAWMMALLAVAVALGTYPIVRRLTKRLETVQLGVERWGAGDLSTRLPEDGQDEVAFLARRFNHSAERIETLLGTQKALVASQQVLLASQKTLLANASHELRSPLTRIRMGLELMQDMAPTLAASRTALPPEGANFPRGGPSENYAPTPAASRTALPPEGANFPRGGPSENYAPTLAASRSALLHEINRNISELDQLIEEILLASRLDAQEADMGTVEAVDLLGLTAEEAARFEADLDVSLGTGATHGALQGTAELSVQGVAKLLRRALRNLLENARRHGAGNISVRLARLGDVAEITVCDNGPGVPEAYRARIFDAFFRLPGASERDGGVGLGLALVKSIATRHGGNVRVDNRAGGGASFTLTLPIRAHAEGPSASGA